MTDRTADCPPGGNNRTRRRLLRGLVAAGLVAGTAGCASSVGRGPDARVVYHETEPEIGTLAVGADVTVTALVANLGDPGAVTVIAEGRETGREEPHSTRSLNLEMERNEQREITFEMEIPPAVDYLDTRAEVE
jgi:hypothetical protein